MKDDIIEHKIGHLVITKARVIKFRPPQKRLPPPRVGNLDTPVNWSPCWGGECGVGNNSKLPDRSAETQRRVSYRSAHNLTEALGACFAKLACCACLTFLARRIARPPGGYTCTVPVVQKRCDISHGRGQDKNGQSVAAKREGERGREREKKDRQVSAAAGVCTDCTTKSSIIMVDSNGLYATPPQRFDLTGCRWELLYETPGAMRRNVAFAAVST